MGYYQCYNCGNSLDKENAECQKCGYIKPTLVTKNSMALIYCEGCGCTYSQVDENVVVCGDHDVSRQKKVNLIK